MGMMCRTVRSCLLMVALLLACSPAPEPAAERKAATEEKIQAGRDALGDSLLTLFDSVSAIHSAIPDTGLLRRLHPPADTLLFVEGTTVEHMTGDSLFRRVLAAHGPVTSMTQEFTGRSVQLLDRHTAVLTAVETVHWNDHLGPHAFQGLMTLVVSRVHGRWVIRAVRG